jgi:hypothetical protein
MESQICSRYLRRPSASGRASAAIAPIHPSGDIIVLEQPALTCRDTALLDLSCATYPPQSVGGVLSGDEH